MSTGDYNCEMGFIVDKLVTRVELVNAVYIAKKIKTAHYTSVTTLTGADATALFPASTDTLVKDVGYTKAQKDLTADKEYIAATTGDQLNKQLGIGAIALQRTT